MLSPEPDRMMTAPRDTRRTLWCMSDRARRPLSSLSGGLTREQCEELLGEPIVVADPVITTAQTARVLEIRVVQVYRLVRQGWLQRHGAQRTARCILLSDVLVLREAITAADAAELIGCRLDDVLAMVESRRLRPTGDSLRPVRRVDAMIDVGRRHKPGPARPARSQTVLPDQPAQEQPDRPVTPHPDPAPDDGKVGVGEAAARLGLSEVWVYELARTERLPAERDSLGRWRFDPLKLSMVLRAWQHARDHGRLPPTLSRRRRRS